MTCDQVRPELVAFHFGTVSDRTRALVEDHLLQCQVCLRQLFALKAEIETASCAIQPSDVARSRLRRAVEREVCGGQFRPWRWWEGPLALGFASAAIVASVVTVEVLRTGEGSPPHAVLGRAIGTSPGPDSPR